MSVIRNLVIRAGADFSQMRQEMQRANQSMKVFSSQIKVSMAGIAASLAALGIGAAIKEATSDAIKVEAAVQQLSRTMGASAIDFKNWAEQSAIAFNLSKSEAIRFGSTYSNLVSGFEKDTTKTMKYTEDLLKSSAIVASATGRDMEDVMDRIRSGMLGETDAIEDLGINVNNAMIVSTEAFKKFANGKSWDKLSYQTQQQIMYFGILEQATKKYGSTIADNTASRQQQFIAQLKNTQLSLGQAFLPIYNAVLPALTRMVEGISTAMNYVAQFSQALFGKAAAAPKQVDAQATSVEGLGDAYKDAGKAAKGALASFDEVNSLADSAGEGSGSTAPTASLPKISDLASGTAELGGISARIQELADNFRNAMKNFLPEEDKKRLSESLGSLKKSFGELGASISDLLNSVANSKPIQDFWDKFKSEKANQIASSIDSISGGISAWAGTLQLVSGIISGDFQKALGGFEKNISGAYDSITGFIGIFSPETAAKMQSWKQSFSDSWSTLKDEIKKFGDPAKLEALDFAEYIRDKVSTKFVELQTSLSKTWYAIETGIVWGAVKDTIVGHWEQLKGDTGTAWDKLKGVIENKWSLITGIDFSGVKTGLLGIWNALSTETSTIWDGMLAGIKGSINSAINLINKFTGYVNSIKIDIPSVSIPGTDIKFGGGSIGLPKIPSIPSLNVGTNYVQSSGLAEIHEGEAVVPKKYNPAAGGGMDTDMIDRMASAIGSAVLTAMQMGGGSSNKGGSGDTILNIDGTTIARAIAPYLNKENNRIGGAMISIG